MTADQDVIAFAEKTIALLEQGRTTATYKYAVLLALIDLCVEGGAPESVTTRQLAKRVIELYWPHTIPFDRTVLRQNVGGDAEILTLIATFRTAHARDPSSNLFRARREAPAASEKLVGAVEWKLVEMPLPLVQKFGRTEDHFIYRISWQAGIRKREFLSSEFVNTIRFVGRAADHLVRLAGLLRPLIQQRWIDMVARLNDLLSARLEEHLFGPIRASLAAVGPGLRELQDNRCFYCDGRVPSNSADIDHFIPWSRIPMDSIENLVLADRGCNGRKSDFLAAAEHVRRWSARLAHQASDLRAIAERVRWDTNQDRALGVSRAVYRQLQPSARLWLRGDTFVHPDRAAITLALAG